MAIQKLDVSIAEDGVVMIGLDKATGNIAATAMIAYYNAAAEYEAIGDWAEAKEHYEVSQHIARQIADASMGQKISKAL